MICIQLMRREDIPAVADIHVQSWRAGYRGLIPNAYLDSLDSERWIRAFEGNYTFPGPHPRGLILWVDGIPVGVSHVAAARDEGLPDTVGEIISLYLLPDYWGRGLGVRLLEAALDELRKMGYTSCILWTLQENARAQRAYARAGFLADGAAKEMEIGGTTAALVRFAQGLT